MRAYVYGIGTGSVVNTRFDDRGEAIFTVRLDNPAITPDGLYYARADEFMPIGSERI